MITFIVAFICIIGMSFGQVLYKFSAAAINKSGTFLEFRAMQYFLLAVAVYGATSIIWVWILQRTQLSKIYPFMALSFIIVPLLSYFFFNEKLTPQYVMGVLIIMLGIGITLKA